MSDKRSTPSSSERRGGYSGGQPASTMRPPKQMPSGAVKAVDPVKPHKQRER